MFSPVGSWFPSIQYRTPSQGVVPHMLRASLLEMSSQAYPEVCFPGDSQPVKPTVKTEHPVTAPFRAGRGWVAFLPGTGCVHCRGAGPPWRAPYLFLLSAQARKKSFQPQHGLTSKLGFLHSVLFSFFSSFQTTTQLILFVCFLPLECKPAAREDFLLLFLFVSLVDLSHGWDRRCAQRHLVSGCAAKT